MKKNQVDRAVVALTDEQKKEIMEQIHGFFLEEYDEDLGLIKQQRIFELFAEQLAPIVYNKALDDANLWYKRQQENLESDFYSLYKEIR